MWAGKYLPELPPESKPLNLQTRIRRWREDAQERRWKEYQESLGSAATPAQIGIWGKKRIDFHEGLQKAEASAAIQLRSQHIGFNRYLYKRKVPGNEGPECPCGWQNQDSKHVLIHCPTYQQQRPKLFLTAGTCDYTILLTSPKGIRAAARWLISSGALRQYSLAKVQLEGDGSEEDQTRVVDPG